MFIEGSHTTKNTASGNSTTMALEKINTLLMLRIAHKVVNYILCNHRWPCELTHFTYKIGGLPMIIMFIEAGLIE
jgi:hypothetical protein